MKLNISAVLKQMRNQSGLTVPQVIDKLKQYDINISANTLYNYENSHSNINGDVLIALSLIYHCVNPLEYFGVPTIRDLEFVNDFLNCDSETQKDIKQEVSEKRKALEDANSFDFRFSLIINGTEILAAKPINGLPIESNIDKGDLALVENEVRDHIGILPQNKDLVKQINRLRISVREFPLMQNDWIILGKRIAIRRDIPSTYLKHQCIYEAAGYIKTLEEDYGWTLWGKLPMPVKTVDEIYSQAQKWSYENFVSISAILEAYTHDRSHDNIARYLQITSEYLSDALDYYDQIYQGKYEHDNYIISFKPKIKVTQNRKRKKPNQEYWENFMDIFDPSKEEMERSE